MWLSDYEDPFFLKPRSVEEIAEWLGATPSFVYREIVRGKLRGLKFTPKSIRIMPEDIRDWLEHAATKPKRKQENAPNQLEEA
jgi:excisionase family DNA binding protein